MLNEFTGFPDSPRASFWRMLGPKPAAGLPIVARRRVAQAIPVRPRSRATNPHDELRRAPPTKGRYFLPDRPGRHKRAALTALDIFPQKVLYTESRFPIRGISPEKSAHRTQPLNHRKSDSYAAAAAERRSAGARIPNPEGSRPSPGCRPQAFPVRPPRCDRNPDRLPPRLTRQRTVRIDLEYD